LFNRIMNDPDNRHHQSAPDSCGSIPGLAGEPAFVLERGASAAIPLLIAVPHAGRCYSPSLVDGMRMPEAASLRLEDRHIDHVGQALARSTGASLLVARAPRALIDLNRSLDDMDWDMVADRSPEEGASGTVQGRRARSGLGLVPRRLPGMGELWRGRIAGEDLDARLREVHRPYHTALATTLESIRDRWGVALLIDLHSMPPIGPKRGAMRAPDFVLGDRFGASCDNALSSAALDTFAALGEVASHNRPYAGGYVLDRHSCVRRNIHAVQIEVCRATYLDRRLREPGSGMAHVGAVLGAIVRRLSEELLGRARPLSEAAE